MPGSPATSTAEPGTRPPPRTRSSSAMPVGRRGASLAAAARVSSVARRPLPPLIAISPGDPDGARSSMMEFHSPHEAHLPDQRLVTAPQAWQTKAREALAMVSALASDIAPEGAPAEIGEDLVIDGAGVVGEFVRRHIRSDQFDKSAAPRELLRHPAYVEYGEVHRDPADDRRGMRPEIAGVTLLAIGDRERPEEAVGITDRDDREPCRLTERAGCAIADGFSRRGVAHTEDAAHELHHRTEWVVAMTARAAAI